MGVLNVKKDYLNIVKKWKNNENGSIRLANGTELILQLNTKNKNEWLHELYASLEDDEIKQIKQDSPIPLPQSYLDFLKEFNGLQIFNGQLNIYGLYNNEKIYEKDKAPFDLFDINNIRVKNTPNEWFFFGSYGYDGTKMMFDTSQQNNKVYRTERYSLEILNEWESFEEWLNSEVERIANHFEENGNCLVEDLTPKKH